MPIIQQWSEISEEEFNKLSEDWNNELKEDIVIPDDIVGIIARAEYMWSDTPKKHKYYKCVGHDLLIIAGAEFIKHFKSM